MTKSWLRLLCGAILLLACARGMAAGRAEHVVIVVWDGMRPDFVSSRFTPTLLQLAERGVFFKFHHSSYVSSTEVNGAAIATGMYPSHDGILANSQYRSDLSWLSAYGTENFDAMRRGDSLWEGHYLEASTLPEILQEAGFPTITAGAKPVVLLHDRAFSKLSATQQASTTLFRGQTLPRARLQALVHDPVIGPFPLQTVTGTRAKVIKWLRSAQDEVFLGLYGRPRSLSTARAIDAWTTRALVHGLWKNGLPKYSLLWLSEPDASQHQSGPGSDNALAGLAQCDRNLALVLKALRDKGVLDRTDVFVVSDHGFSTVDRGPELVKLLKKAGFVAGTQYENPEAGDVLVVNLGGSTFLYVFGHHEATIRRLVDYLQGTDFAGVIFSSLQIEGTFPLSLVHLDAAHSAPDVVLSMRWNSSSNIWGVPGMVTAADGKRGRGTHASLCPSDLHNTLIAAGPDFKSGFVDELPSGNVDLAPTILALLGLSPPKAMDGRVLSEAMTDLQLAPPIKEEHTVEATRDLGSRIWRQSLRFTRVGSVVYYDEGRNESRLK